MIFMSARRCAPSETDDLSFRASPARSRPFIGQSSTLQKMPLPNPRPRQRNNHPSSEKRATAREALPRARRAYAGAADEAIRKRVAGARRSLRHDAEQKRRSGRSGRRCHARALPTIPRHCTSPFIRTPTCGSARRKRCSCRTPTHTGPPTEHKKDLETQGEWDEAAEESGRSGEGPGPARHRYRLRRVL